MKIVIKVLLPLSFLNLYTDLLSRPLKSPTSSYLIFPFKELLNQDAFPKDHLRPRDGLPSRSQRPEHVCHPLTHLSFLRRQHFRRLLILELPTQSSRSYPRASRLQRQILP